mmetsp:Transcript_27199/g.20354  ORF Transcript_27199/g.20354 Transcript_27199/m.20354 type:complete len:167 (+) Transcript_27199:193-693(+)
MVASCGFYFHRKCMEKESNLLPKTITSQIRSPVFICGSHYCHNCFAPFRTEEQIVRCIRCVTAYHDMCKELNKIQQLNHKNFICHVHTKLESSMGDGISAQLKLSEPDAEDDFSSRAYKRMRTKLRRGCEDGSLVQMQVIRDPFACGPPSCREWRRVDPSETLVVS